MEELVNYLTHITTPENLTIIVDSCKIIEECGIQSHLIELEEVVILSGNNSSENNFNAIYAILLDKTYEIISEFSIELKIELLLNQANDVLRALTVLPNYNNPLELLDVIEGDGDNQDKLADMLAIVSPLKWENFIEYIESVSDGFLIQLTTHLNDVTCDDSDLDLDRVNELKARFIPFKKKYKIAIVNEALDAGIKLGSPISKIVDGFNDELEALNINNELLVKELLGMVLMSDASDKEIPNIMEDLLEDYSKNINENTKALAYFKKLFKELGDE